MQHDTSQSAWASIRRPSIRSEEGFRPHTSHGKEPISPTFVIDCTTQEVLDANRKSNNINSQDSLFRDDTAAELRAYSTESSTKQTNPTHEAYLSSLSGEERIHHLRLHRKLEKRRQPFTRTVSQLSHTAELEAIYAEPEHPPRETATIGRAFSRRFGRQVQSLGESVKPSWPMSITTRGRRSSAPKDIGTSELQTMGGRPPTSPSKRNGIHADDRSKRFRTVDRNHLLSDRKDTPAPSTISSSSTRRPASRSNPPCPLLISGGGSEARRAAADSNSHRYIIPAPQPTYDAWSSSSDLEDIIMPDYMRGEKWRKQRRLGSNTSAADSGTDLTEPAVPRDCDSAMDIDTTIPAAPVEKHIDFTRAKLPDEICLQIFQYLDAPDLARCLTVSPEWNSFANDVSVWRSAFLRKYQRHIYTDPAPIQVGGEGVGRPNRPYQQWAKMYKARVQLDDNWRKGAKTAGKAVYLSGHSDSVYCLQFDEHKIITGSRDRTIRVWDINTYQCLRVIGGPNVKPEKGPKVLRTVDYPSFHMATASVNGTNYGNGIFHTPSQWHDASILCLQYDEKILVTGSSDSDLLIWDIETYEPIKRLRKHQGGVLDVALDAKHIVSCSKDSRIIVWDRETYEPKAILAGHRGPVNAVQLRGNFLVSASGDGVARLWDLSTMKLTKEFSAKERGLAAVEFSEDMKYVLAGGNDHITYKFETETGKEVAQFVGHSQLVRSLWLDSANKRVVSGSYDLDLRVYDFETGQEIWRAEEWTTSWMLAAKSDYRRIVSTSQDGRILIVDFGLKIGGREDGQQIDNMHLLRGTDKTSEIIWRDPWAS